MLETVMRIDRTGNWYREVRGKHFKLTHDDPNFRVRESQLAKDIVVGYRNQSPYDCYVLKKSLVKKTYTIYTIEAIHKRSYFANILIRKFVDKEIDFYYWYKNKKFYNENNEEVDVVDLNYLDFFLHVRNICPIRDNIYLLYRDKRFLTIFDYQPKVTFVFDKSTQRMFRSEGIDAYVFEDSLLKFRVNKYFVKRLRRLETVDEMKELIQRELTMSVI
jgi:hypothetical protein